MSTEHKLGLPNINLIKNHKSTKWEYLYHERDKNPGYLTLTIEDGEIVLENRGTEDNCPSRDDVSAYFKYLLRPVTEDKKAIDWKDIEYIKNLPSIEDVTAHEKNGACWEFKSGLCIQKIHLFVVNGKINASWSKEGHRKFEPTKSLGWHDVSYCPSKDTIASWNLLNSEIVMNKTIPSVEAVDKHFKENGGRWNIENNGYVYLRATNGNIECSLNSGRSWDEKNWLKTNSKALTAVTKEGHSLNARKGFPDKEIIKAHEATGGLWRINDSTAYEFKIIDDVINVNVGRFEPAISSWANDYWLPVDENNKEVPWPIVHKKGLPSKELIEFHKGEWSFKERRPHGPEEFFPLQVIKLKRENGKIHYKFNSSWSLITDNYHNFELDEYAPMKDGKIISWAELEADFNKSKEMNMPVLSGNVASIIPVPFPTMNYEKKEEKAPPKLPKPAAKKDAAPTMVEKIAIRTGAKQLTKRGQELIINLMTKHLKGKEKTKAITSLQEALASPMGYCLVGLVLSTIVKEVPTIYKATSGKEFKSSRLDMLVDELRIEGASEVGSMLMDLLTNIGSLNLIQEEPKEKLEIPLVAEELTPA